MCSHVHEAHYAACGSVVARRFTVARAGAIATVVPQGAAFASPGRSTANSIDAQSGTLDAEPKS